MIGQDQDKIITKHDKANKTGRDNDIRKRQAQRHRQRQGQDKSRQDNRKIIQPQDKARQ